MFSCDTILTNQYHLHVENELEQTILRPPDSYFGLVMPSSAKDTPCCYTLDSKGLDNPILYYSAITPSNGCLFKSTNRENAMVWPKLYQNASML